MMALLLLLGCAPETPHAWACNPDTVGTVERLAPEFPRGTEGIAVWGGRLYVSVPDGVVRIEAGVAEPFVSLNAALGLAASEDRLWVADPGEFTFDGNGLDGALLLVEPDGSARAVARSLANPNGVVVAPWGEVLVSDDTRDGIVAVDPDTGEVRPWVEGLPSPNGMVFSADGAWLYVASTYVLPPPLWRVPVDEDGVPGEPEPITTLPTASGPDGLAVDAEGQLWVALNARGEIARVDPETGGYASIALGLESPASLVFGSWPGTDPCSVYATELYGDGVVRVSAGVTGL